MGLEPGPVFSLNSFKYIPSVLHPLTVILLKLPLCQTPASSGASVQGKTVPGEDAVSSFRAKLGLEHLS